ncbi:MAG: helix-turn-helix domain-containing protein [Oscillospiraceae bacterium]
MFDSKIVGKQIATMRKKNMLSQEQLAELLILSPQAISKWENGHSLPDIATLPMLAQVFSCSIDDLIMPAFSFDERIEDNKPNILEKQAEHIAAYILQHLQRTNTDNGTSAIDDHAIIQAVSASNPNMGNITVCRNNQDVKSRYTDTYITVSTPQKDFKILQRVYAEQDREILGLDLLRKHTDLTPYIFHLDYSKKSVLMEDLNDGYIQGFYFNENNQNGDMVRASYLNIIESAAKMHAAFWEKGDAFEQVGLDWRHESNENLLAHIAGMEKDFHLYRQKEQSNEIPQKWECFENNLDVNKLDYFQDAINRMKRLYLQVLFDRFHSGRNITVIHGDLHPGNTFVSKLSSHTVKMIDFQAVRIGLCTEDLAMLIALHIEPDKRHAMPLIDHYYSCLTKTVADYPYDLFMEDLKLSVMESMFFTIRLMNQGIYDFSMRDKAIKAFETFVL